MAMSDSVATAAVKALCFELSGTIAAGFGTPRGDSYVVLNALAWVISTVVAHIEDSAGTRATALDYFMRALAANLAKDKDSDDLIRVPPPSGSESRRAHAARTTTPSSRA